MIGGGRGSETMAQGVAGVLDPAGSWVVLVLSLRGISPVRHLHCLQEIQGEKAANRSRAAAERRKQRRHQREQVSQGHTAPHNS